MKTSLVFFIVLIKTFSVYTTADPYFCVPNKDIPIAASQKKHNVYRLKTPIKVSYGGYVDLYPEGSIEGVVSAVDRSYEAIQVSAGYLRSQEVAMISETTLDKYVGNDPRKVYELTGDEFGDLVFKKQISYDTLQYSYTGVYRASFLYEIFDQIPNFKKGVFFIDVVADFINSIYPDQKVLAKLTMRWIKYVIDTFEAWNRVIVYDPDVIRALDVLSEFGCNHLYGFKAHDILFFNPIGHRAIRQTHQAVHALRDCAYNFTDPVIEYNDFMLESGSLHRVSCISMTMADIGTFDYKLNTSPNKGKLTDFIYQNYYFNTSSYYVGLHASPYDLLTFGGSYSRLRDTIKKRVDDYSLQFYITPVP